MMPFGAKMMPGEVWSGHYPGYISMPDGRLRKREEYVAGGEKRYSVNRYYLRVDCPTCGKEHLQDQANARKGYRSFCCHSCRVAFREEETAGRKMLKKRRHGAGSHVLVKNKTHPRSNRHGYVYEHILVAEKKVGRNIQPNERVHHINCVKDDNRPENLFVCADDREHFLIHGTLNRCVAELLETGGLQFDAATKSYVVRKA